MKVTGVKTQKRSDSIKNYGKIISWGSDNAYPQRLQEIIQSSGTGRVCVDLRRKFIKGQGFSEDLGKIVINEKGTTLAMLLDEHSRDDSYLDGIAMHFNFNALFQITEINFVPVDSLRFSLPDESGEIKTVFQHDDWGKRNTAIKQFNIANAREYDLFVNDINYFNERVEFYDGIENYPGMILFISNMGDKIYPLPTVDACATDMNSEDGVATIKNRNCKNNFLPAGAIIKKSTQNPNITEGQPDAQRNGEDDEFGEVVKKWQGDENAAKLIVIETDFNEDKPELIKFEMNNYDKAFEYTETSTQANIRQVMMIPPILVGVDVGAGFGAELMTNAYKYYNTVTQGDRDLISRVYHEVFLLCEFGYDADFTIKELEYGSESATAVPPELMKDLTVNERRALAGFEPLADDTQSEKILAETLGVGGTQSLTGIISDQAIPLPTKYNLLILLFNFSPEDATKLTGYTP